MKKTEEKTKEKEGIQIPALHKARGMSSMGLNLQNSTVSKTNLDGKHSETS